MMRKALLVAALAVGAMVPFAQRAVALDNTSYAFYSAGKSSDDSWDKCDDDYKFGKSFRNDKDRKKCVSKPPTCGCGSGGGWSNWATKTDFDDR